MRDAMELVASRVDELGKSKIVTLPPQPTPTPTTSHAKPKSRKKQKETAYAEWDSKQYKGSEAQRKQDRENRHLVREARQKQIEEDLARKVQELQPLGEEEEAEAPEPDPPVPDLPVPEKPTKAKESVGARNKRLELERRKKAKADREAEIAKAAENPPDPDPPKAKSPRKGKSPARSTKDQETPEVKSPKKGRSPGRSTASKTPKAKQKPGIKDNEQPEKSELDRPKGKSPRRTKNIGKPGGDGATSQEVAGRTKNAKNKAVGEGDDAPSRPVAKKSTVQHIDDENYELDMNTGKFVKKKLPKKKPDVRDDDDEDDIEMEEIDDVDKDADYDPDKELDQGDDEDGDEQRQDEDDDDDFPIPPLRSKKVKASDKSTSQKKKKVAKGKTGADAALEELADFVEEAFKKPTKPKQVKRKGVAQADQDACINPVEAARFRKAMRDEVLELEKAVKKGTNVADTYHTMIVHIVQACKDMNYDIPVDIEAEDIFPTIEDPTCKAWQLKLQGVETAGEGELNVSKTDNSGVCVAKKKFQIKDIMEYVEEVSRDWTELKRKNFLLSMKKVMGNMTVAHRMVAEASQEMINLLDEVDLPLWMKLQDMTMCPLVHLEVPEVAIMCEEARQMSKGNEQNWDQTTKVTTIMEAKCLPFLPTAWGYDKEGRAKKVIAGIIYKYVKDRMYGGKIETPATEVSKKYALNATTMNRHILGKKYGGGKPSGSGTRRPVAQKVTATDRLIEKSRKKTVVEADGDDDDEDEEEEDAPKKAKGKGKRSGKTRLLY